MSALVSRIRTPHRGRGMWRRRPPKPLAQWARDELARWASTPPPLTFPPTVATNGAT